MFCLHMCMHVYMLMEVRSVYQVPRNCSHKWPRATTWVPGTKPNCGAKEDRVATMVSLRGCGKQQVGGQGGTTAFTGILCNYPEGGVLWGIFVYKKLIKSCRAVVRK